MTIQNLLKFPGAFFNEVVPTLFAATYPVPDDNYLSFDIPTGVYTFTFDGKKYKSDSAEELVEIAIREIEKAVAFKIGSRLDQCPYISLPLACGMEGPSIDICDAFAVLERPYRIEFYTDTFRRGLHRLKELRG